MSWTTPKTWNPNEVPGSNDYNKHIRDNLNYLHDRPGDSNVVDEASDYTTTVTTFTDVDATELARTITTTGGDVLVMFVGTVALGTIADLGYFTVDIDGSPYFADDGLYAIRHPDQGSTGRAMPVAFCVPIEGLSAGSHTFKLQWKVQSGGDITLYAGAGTANKDTHPVFGVKEV